MSEGQLSLQEAPEKSLNERIESVTVGITAIEIKLQDIGAQTPTREDLLDIAAHFDALDQTM